MANPAHMVTPVVRFSHFYGIIPKVDKDDDGKEIIKYRTQIIFDKTDKTMLDAIRACYNAAVEHAVKKKWGGVKPVKINFILRDGDTEMEQKTGKLVDPAIYGGKFFMNVGTTDRPQVWDPHGKPIVNAAGQVFDPQGIVSGDFGRVGLNFFGYKGKQIGITAALTNIQLYKKGDPLGVSRSRPEDEFSDGFAPDESDSNDMLGAAPSSTPATSGGDPLADLMGGGPDANDPLQF